MVRTRNQAREIEPQEHTANKTPSARSKDGISRKASTKKDTEAKSVTSPKPGRRSLSSDNGKKAQPSTKPGVLTFNVFNGSSTINCDLRPSHPSTHLPLMIFTHGAGGTISTPAVANFAEGFSAAYPGGQGTTSSSTTMSSIVCFQGSMNLKSRTSMFHSVMRHCTETMSHENNSSGVTVLGGRSMGARAAVLAVGAGTAPSDTTDHAKHVKKLVLVSYPLQGQNGAIRDEILIDIDESIEVLFVSGDRDNMCNLEELEIVRKKMKARTWLVTVEGANHGMECKQKKRTGEMQMVTGRIAAEWAMNDKVKSTNGDVGEMHGCAMLMSLPLNEASKSGESKVPSRANGSSRKRQSAMTEKDRGNGPAQKRKRQKTK